MDYIDDPQTSPAKINLATKNTQNNFWLNQYSTTGSLSSALYPKVKYAPYTRLNQPKLDVKQMGGYVSDSTAINMGDPSSMRD